MSTSNQPIEVENNAKALIKALTGYQENEENFHICLNFALSNFFSHNFLDVDPFKVQKSISGFHEKFLIHSDLKKAKSFNILSTKLLNIFNNYLSQERKNGYSVLSLLLHLSNSVNNDNLYAKSSQVSDEDKNENESFDWAAYLQEGEIYNIESDNSQSFSSEEDSSAEEEVDYLFPPLRVPPRDDSGIGISPDSNSGTSPHLFHVTDHYSTTTTNVVTKSPSLQDQNSFYPYWLPEHQKQYGSSTLNLISVNFTKIWEEYLMLVCPTYIIQKKVVVHERNVIREVLWMLNGIKDSFVFSWDGEIFLVNSSVHLCSLSALTLGNILKEFCDYGTKRAEMQDFVQKIAKENIVTCSKFCLTFQSYASALHQVLIKFSNDLIQIEKILKQRQEAYTLLKLKERLKDQLHNLNVVYNIHQIIAKIPQNCPPYEKTIRLLQILWEHLSQKKFWISSLSSIKIILTIFVKSCYPFFKFLENLLFQNLFLDTYQEFIVYKKNNKIELNESFWEESLFLQALPSDIEKDFFLKSFMDIILVAGKSLIMLQEMSYKEHQRPFEIHIEKDELFFKFVFFLKNYLKSFLQDKDDKLDEESISDSYNFSQKNILDVNNDELVSDNSDKLNENIIYMKKNATISNHFIDDILNTKHNENFDQINEHFIQKASGNSSVMHASTENKLANINSILNLNPLINSLDKKNNFEEYQDIPGPSNISDSTEAKNISYLLDDKSNIEITDKITNNEVFEDNSKKQNSMFEEIIEEIQKENKFKKNLEKFNKIIECYQKKPPKEINHSLFQPKFFDFNEANIKYICPNAFPTYKEHKEDITLYTQKQEEAFRYIDDLEASNLRPLNKSIMKAFENCITFACYPICETLVDALRKKYSLMLHMSVMKKYFLMEAGNLMFSFYSKIFEKIFYNESWEDVAFLYCSLQNALDEDKETCEKLFAFVDHKSNEVQSKYPLSILNSLNLSYEVEWPISILLGPQKQNQYHLIFHFLLQIKCAKYILDELYCTSLPSEINLKHLSKFMKLVLKSEFPKQQKIHGMYIIRMRLMFFVNGLHNYIMTRILHSFGLEFTKNLENAKTVEEMIVAHNKYLKSLQERCLLDPRLPYLKEQIFHVLNLTYKFQQLWLSGIDNINLEELQNIEVEFSTSCNFLTAFLSKPLKRKSYPHLEALSSSMLSETHLLHVFGSKKDVPSFPFNSKNY